MNKFSFLFLFLFLLTLGSCTVNRAKVNNDLKKYFDSAHVDGSFSFLNNQLGDITVYNMKLDTLRLSPGTSFKILNTLIGVQTGKIMNENTVIKTDSAANKSLTLKEAFNTSSVPYFQSMARQIGKDTMKFWIDSISYGNKNISGPVDSFWLNNTLKISPDEQLGLMSKIYFEQLPFQKYAQQMVESLMLQEDNTLYKLSYTTGTGIDEKNNSFGWTLGWVEENRHVYFFVTFIKTPDRNLDLKATAIHISKSILKEMGFFKGEK
ncbi:MAG TPA: penicillin-binding transpeptidase domain-containing protein [Hanamia sp.]|jgi:beta-lactamase class D|nr:penicillin-binding transpeptidase domain-containing protein [Hanamia sp.]